MVLAIIAVLALISDGPLTGDRADCLDHVEILRSELAAVLPGLAVMACGRALEGVASEADLCVARDRHARWGYPWVSVPGKHDGGGRAGRIAFRAEAVFRDAVPL